MKPMTDLEGLVRHLAGREPMLVPSEQGQSDQLTRSLDDSSHEASLVLDEIRRRTRSLFDESAATTMLGATTNANGSLDPVATSLAARPPSRQVHRDWTTIFLLGLLTLLTTWGFIRQEILQGSNVLSHQGKERVSDNLKTDRVVSLRAEPPFDRALGSLADVCTRIEHDLAALDTKLDAITRTATPPSKLTVPEANRTTPPLADAASLSFGADLATLRREVAGSEMAVTRQIQEMRTVLQEVNTVVRRVLSRPQVAPPSNLSLPILIVTVQALINNLQNPSAQIRGEAVEQLVRIGSPARSAIPALQQRLSVETDSNVRTAIETAINVLTSN